MATSQSGKRKLIPHAQKDGSSAWKENGERRKKYRGMKRAGLNRMKSKRGSSSLFLSFATLFSTPHLSTNQRFTTTSKETIESVFQGDCKHRETLVERLFRLRLIGYGDAVWNMHAHRSWHSPRGGNLHKRGPRWWNEICAINRRSLLRYFVYASY